MTTEAQTDEAKANTDAVESSTDESSSSDMSSKITDIIASRADERAAKLNDEEAGKGKAKVEKQLPPDEVQPGEEVEEVIDSSDGKPSKPASAGPDKKTIQEAVRAGIDIEDAESFSSNDALKRQIALLDSKSDKGKEGETEETEESEKDPFDSIPDLDPEEYEDTIVDGFKFLKETVKAQREQIALLREGNAGNSFDSQIQSLGKPVTDAIGKDPTRKTELQTKIKFLKAGYESIGKEVEDSEVFQEAAEAVFSSELANAKGTQKQARAKSRNKQITNRPSGQGLDSPVQDRKSAVADVIKKKYFKN